MVACDDERSREKRGSDDASVDIAGPAVVVQELHEVNGVNGFYESESV